MSSGLMCGVVRVKQIGFSLMWMRFSIYVICFIKYYVTIVRVVETPYMWICDTYNINIFLLALSRAQC